MPFCKSIQSLWESLFGREKVPIPLTPQHHNLITSTREISISTISSPSDNDAQAPATCATVLICCALREADKWTPDRENCGAEGWALNVAFVFSPLLLVKWSVLGDKFKVCWDPATFLGNVRGAKKWVFPKRIENFFVVGQLCVFWEVGANANVEATKPIALFYSFLWRPFTVMQARITYQISSLWKHISLLQTIFVFLGSLSVSFSSGKSVSTWQQAMGPKVGVV